MRFNGKWLAVLLLLAAIPLSGCGFMNRLKARDNLTKGSRSFNEQKYDAAAQFFAKAVELDPTLEDARMYLASAYMMQFVPGSTDSKSEEMANKAIQTFTQVVDMAKDPANPNRNAMIGIASLYYQLRRYDDSKTWCQKILKIDPQNAEAYYRIGVMDFEDVIEKTGNQGQNVEYLTPEEKAKALQNIEDGLANVGKAIQIRRTYFDAMMYQNLLWREKAKFETDGQKKADLLRQADEVWEKALVLQRQAQEADAKKLKKLGAAPGGGQ